METIYQAAAMPGIQSLGPANRHERWTQEKRRGFMDGVI